MCGIVGYIGSADAREVIIRGLLKLEYRGYDSAGVALLNNNSNKLEIYKEKGRVSDLRGKVDFSFKTNFGLGHTRWATHGKPSYVNSHPHYSQSGRFVIVHNGVIENFKRLRIEKLKDYKFVSETDTEVIANLIEYYSERMAVSDAIRKALSLLEGSYALIIIDKMDMNLMYVAKNKTPLLIGKSENGITIASDTMAMVGYADEYVLLEDKTFGIIKNNSIELYDIIGTTRIVNLKPLSLQEDDIAKGNYEHYMLKEIDEQPGVIRRIIQQYFVDESISIDSRIIDELRDADKIYFVACGTSMHASYIGKYYFERLCEKPVDVCIASEVAYLPPFMSANPFFIFLSQSGETADCISVLKYCKQHGVRTLAITNSNDSTMDELADNVLHIYAGKEISVASTKAYTAQVVVLAILARAVSGLKTNLKNNLNKIALAIEEVFSNKEVIKKAVEVFKDAKSSFYIGRGLDYYTASEAALKLKEISYIHSEGFASGELKHGSIALIEEGTPVVAIITQDKTNLITRSNLVEAESRGAHGIVISTNSLSNSDDDIVISDVAHYLAPIVSIVVAQLIAYYVAILRGNDVDKPRNLAKSVTVE